MLRVLCVVPVLCALCLGGAVMAQEPSAVPSPDAGEGQESATPVDKATKWPVDIHGFVLGAGAARTTGERPRQGEGGDVVLGEGRLRLDLGAATRDGQGYFLLKTDFLYDAVAQEFEADLREGYVGYTRGALDLRLGRQIFTWGVGDLFFINDVFPKDFDSFFSGRPLEYLKVGVESASLRYTSSLVNVEVIVIPVFTPDRLPSPRRFFLFAPFAALPKQREVQPATSAANTEIAVRLSRRIAEADIAVYAYRGHWRIPSIRLDDAGAPTTATRFYPPLSVYGASAQRSLWGGVLSLEAGYYDSRQDRSGHDPTLPNSQWRFLAGYQRELAQDFTAGFQVYSEHLLAYRAYRQSLPAGSPVQDRWRTVLSLRLTKLLEYQTWVLSLFAAYSPTDKDYFLQPEISHKVTDNLGVALGANIFGGYRRTTFFGQLEQSDTIFGRVRFDF